MPFEEIPHKIRKPVTREGVVRLLATHKRYRKDATGIHYWCRFSFNNHVVKQLGWTHRTRVKFLWGVGDDKGTLRITPVFGDSVEGWYLNQYTGGNMTVLNKDLPNDVSKNDIDRELIFSIHKNDKGVIDITLPKNFYNDTSTTPIVTNSREILFPQNPLNTSDITNTFRPAAILCEPPYGNNQHYVFTTDVLNHHKQNYNIHPDTQSSLTAKVKAASGNSVVKKSLATSKLPVATPPKKPTSENLLVDITKICSYINANMGDLATPLSARIVTINNTEKTHEETLSYANTHRVNKGLDPYKLRTSI